MKPKAYCVKFETGNVIVTAFCEEEAVILARAERIKAGLQWRTIKDIYVVE